MKIGRPGGREAQRRPGAGDCTGRSRPPPQPGTDGPAAPPCGARPVNYSHLRTTRAKKVAHHPRCAPEGRRRTHHHDEN